MVIQQINPDTSSYESTDAVLDYVLRSIHECLEKSPVIILGSGASAAHNIPGMTGLQEHLEATSPVGMDDQDRRLWKTFLSHLPNKGLEGALSATAASSQLNEHVARCTWQLLAQANLDVFHNVIGNRTFLPLTRLYQHLFNSTHRSIEVITTNYDCLAEFAAEAAGFLHSTGFGYGCLRLRDPSNLREFFHGQRGPRRVNIWKVHGSLDWFRDSNEQIIGLPLTTDIYPELKPEIVTPGVDKYRRTHLEPYRTIITGADNALSSALGFLCIGYGFNDEHIQPKLISRCQTERVPLLVVTKSLSAKAKAILNSGEIPHFTCLEEASSNGTLVKSQDYPDGIVIPDISLWQMASLIDKALN